MNAEHLSLENLKALIETEKQDQKEALRNHEAWFDHIILCNDCAESMSELRLADRRAASRRQVPRAVVVALANWLSEIEPSRGRRFVNLVKNSVGMIVEGFARGAERLLIPSLDPGAQAAPATIPARWANELGLSRTKEAKETEVEDESEEEKTQSDSVIQSSSQEEIVAWSLVEESLSMTARVIAMAGEKSGTRFVIQYAPPEEEEEVMHWPGWRIELKVDGESYASSNASDPSGRIDFPDLPFDPETLADPDRVEIRLIPNEPIEPAVKAG